MILNGVENRKHTGMTDKIIKWFHSYHTNGAFFVSLNNVLSAAGTLNCGVLQRFTFGPLLLLLYINDIASSVK